MRTPPALRVTVLALVAAGALAACRRPVQPGVTLASDTTAGGAGARAGGTAAGDPGVRDTIAIADTVGAGSVDAAARSEAEVRNALLAPVYFDFDQSDLSDQTRAALEQKAAVLRRLQNVAMRIVGHTDSRGSDEYNLALGQRRASVVKRYLVERGIAASRLEIVSYGEERPAVAGDDESAYAQNRRAEFEITAGNTAAAR